MPNQSQPRGIMRNGWIRFNGIYFSPSRTGILLRAEPVSRTFTGLWRRSKTEAYPNSAITLVQKLETCTRVSTFTPYSESGGPLTLQKSGEIVSPEQAELSLSGGWGATADALRIG